MSPMKPTAVDNGARLPVAFPFFTGIAGVRLFDDGGELSCFAGVPYPAENVAGRVNGRPALIPVVRKSEVAEGMAVARFRFTDEEQV